MVVFYLPMRQFESRRRSVSISHSLWSLPRSSPDVQNTEQNPNERFFSAPNDGELTMCRTIRKVGNLHERGVWIGDTTRRDGLDEDAPGSACVGRSCDTGRLEWRFLKEGLLGGEI